MIEPPLGITCKSLLKFLNHPFTHPQGVLVGIEPLKVRHDVTKLDLTIPLLSFWCIDIGLSIQFIFLTMYMT